MLQKLIKLLENNFFIFGAPIRGLFLKIAKGDEHLANLIVLYLSNFFYALTTPINSFYIEKNITEDIRVIAEKLNISLSLILSIDKFFMGTIKLIVIMFTGYLLYCSKYYTTPLIISQIFFCINLLLIDIFTFGDISIEWKQVIYYLTVIILSIAEAIRDVARIHLILCISECLYSNVSEESKSSMKSSFLFLRRSIYQLASVISSMGILYLVKIQNNINFLISSKFFYTFLVPIQIIFFILTISFSPTLKPDTVSILEPAMKKYYDKVYDYVKLNGFINSTKDFMFNLLKYTNNCIVGWNGIVNIHTFSILNCILLHVFCSIKKNLLLYVTLGSNTESVYQYIKLAGQISSFVATSIISILLSKQLISNGAMLITGCIMISVYVGFLYGILNKILLIPQNDTGVGILTFMYSLWLISVALINTTVSVVISDYWSNKVTTTEFFSVVRYLSLFLGSVVMQGIFSIENSFTGYAILTTLSLIMLKGILFNYIYSNIYLLERNKLDDKI